MVPKLIGVTASALFCGFGYSISHRWPDVLQVSGSAKLSVEKASCLRAAKIHPAMRVPDNRKTSREGVNTAHAFFEHHDCVFQEIAQQNDFGKDGYLDYGEAGKISALCSALQIKSGTSYRTAKGDYFIPVDDHAESWRRSTVPVFGLVYDPDDALIRWVDLTGYLRVHPDQSGGSVPLPGYHVLDETSLRGAFKGALKAYESSGPGILTLNLLSPGRLQTDAVYDAWALSRSDPKYLLILRRFLMDLLPQALRRAIFLLSHVGSHPNILWTKDNRISQQAENHLLPAFRWSPEEVAHMLTAIDPQDWGYHTLGECLDVLLFEDPNIVSKLRIAVKLLLQGLGTSIRPLAPLHLVWRMLVTNDKNYLVLFRNILH